jgi:hypothetical protein
MSRLRDTDPTAGAAHAAPGPDAVRERATELLETPNDGQLIPVCPRWATRDGTASRKSRVICPVALSLETFERHRRIVELVGEVLTMTTRSAGLATGHSGYPSKNVNALASPEGQVTYRELVLGCVRMLKSLSSRHWLAFSWLVVLLLGAGHQVGDQTADVGGARVLVGEAG